MANVTTDFLAAMMTGYQVIFKQALDEVMKEVQLIKEIATQFPSTTDKETYAWMGAVATMNEWKDQRQYQALKAYSYSLVNKHYEGTIEVDRDAYEDDKYGMMAPRIQGLARRALRHMNEQAVSKLDAGGTDLAYDDIAFFKATGTRRIGASGDIANLLSGSYSADSAEILAALNAVFVAMQSFKDDKGVPMGLMPDTVICSPTMYLRILNALLPTTIGAARPEAGIFAATRVFSTPWVDADALDWYVLCTKAEVKPLIFQLRKDIEFVSLDDPQGEHVFKNKTFLYGVDDRFVVGYGDPRTAIKVVDS